MASYNYEPINLERPAIRLLRLIAGTGFIITCELFQAYLDGDDLIEYEAVSYTWGGDERFSVVNVDGKTLEVTENLYFALWYLRSQETDRILWVDAICINQGNPKEKGHQVQQMGGIYSQAERVIFWLSPPTDATDIFLESMKELEKASTQVACSRWKSSDKRWLALWSSSQCSLKNEHWDLKNRQCHGLKLLLSRPWFKRVWVLQEVANAKRAVVCSGTKCLSARIFALSPILMAVVPEPHCQAVLEIMPGPLREDSWWGETRDLYTLLHKFTDSEASDPRDMVYALIGIGSDTKDDERIQPNYDKDVDKVVQDTFSFLF
ncbi:heterokaryon incompatibility protein-domain-containing protein, partial [Phaeosphaeriaceae sp. PMI808]